MTHELKIKPEYFEAIFWESKKFEIRKNDRDFKVGDILFLREWDGGKYTGNQNAKRVTYILHGPAFGLEEGYCIMSIK